MMQSLCKMAWSFLKKLKIKLLYDPAITRLGIYPKEFETGSQIGTCTPMLTAALFTISQEAKEAPIFIAK